MGCTSSAQKMVSSNANNPDTNVESIEDNDGSPKFVEVNTISENGENITNVIPTCDNLAGPLQLARINKPFVDTSISKTEKDIHGNILLDDSNTIKEYPNKISTLEEIVERVVELYVSDDGVDDEHTETKNTNDRTNIKKHESDKADQNMAESGIVTATSTSSLEHEQFDEEMSSSPTRSESPGSHATRWEALADIAAELPPLLAVDPITGQIYALSK